MKNIRKNAVPPSINRLVEFDAHLFISVMNLANVQIHSMVYEDYYSRWLKRWRLEYDNLSSIMRNHKTELFIPYTQRRYEDLKKLANTMLNVRHRVKEYRRNYFIMNGEAQRNVLRFGMNEALKVAKEHGIKESDRIKEASLE